jgi:hypothetical protein
VEAARSARYENRDYPQKAFLPLEGNHLFHSELAAGTRQAQFSIGVFQRIF